MAAADHVFSAMKHTGLAKEGQIHLQQANFEASVIKKLLRYAKIEVNVRAAKQASWVGNQATNISFTWFNENYPRFPMLLGTTKLKNTSGTHIPWTALFGAQFMKLPWIEAYRTLCNQLGADPRKERIGLCFNVPHAPGASVMVLHNQPVQAENANVVDPERRAETQTRVIRPFGGSAGEPRIVYILESIDSFLTTVGTDWAS